MVFVFFSLRTRNTVVIHDGGSQADADMRVHSQTHLKGHWPATKCYAPLILLSILTKLQGCRSVTYLTVLAAMVSLLKVMERDTWQAMHLRVSEWMSERASGGVWVDGGAPHFAASIVECSRCVLPVSCTLDRDLKAVPLWLSYTLNVLSLCRPISTPLR